jgi:hypothetical protein
LFQVASGTKSRSQTDRFCPFTCPFDSLWNPLLILKSYLTEIALSYEKQLYSSTAEKSTRELIQEFQYDRFQNQTPFYFFCFFLLLVSSLLFSHRLVGAF